MSKPKGWERESLRHSEAKRFGKASPGTKQIIYPRNPHTDYATSIRMDGEGNFIGYGKAKIPRYLYHGTSLNNLKAIAKEGIKANLEPTQWTVEDKHEGDIENNVSLAKDMKDAIMFSLGSTGMFGTQVIFRIDTMTLDRSMFLTRPMFGKKNSEWKYITKDGITPNSIDGAYIRRFMHSKEGKMVYEERFVPSIYFDNIDRIVAEMDYNMRMKLNIHTGEEVLHPSHGKIPSLKTDEELNNYQYILGTGT